MTNTTFENAIAFAQSLIRIPGPPGDEGDVAERTRSELERLGFDDVWTDETGNVIGRVRGTSGAPAVMLSCHLDVVDVGDPEAWEYPPFGGVIEGGWLHGRGAMDIKGPLALQTYAAAQFLERRPPGDVYVAHTVLEERGGWGMQELLERGEVKPAVVIIGEATHGDVCIGHRGRAELIVEIQGVAGHASAPERARNPLRVLAAVLPLVNVFGAQLGEDAMLGKATVAATAVHTLPSSHNVIPDRARVVLDWRVLPDTTAESAVARLDTFLRERIALEEPYRMNVRFGREQQHTWTGKQRERRLFTPGFLMSAEHPVVRAAVAAVGAGSGREPAVRPWTFATNGGHSCGVHQIPTVGFAPGEERFAHTNRERLELPSARQAYGAYPGLIAAVQQAAMTEGD